MKARLLACAAIGLACAVPVVAGAQVAGSQPYGGAAAGAVSPDQVAVNVRAAGFAPLSRAALRGNVYYMRAMSRGKVEVRVAVDARTGRVLSATKVALDSPKPTSSSVPEEAPRYQPLLRGPGYSERAPLPPADVPVENQPAPPAHEPAVAVGSPPPAKKVAAQPPVPRGRPGDAAGDATGSVPQAPAAKPVEAAPSVAAASTPAPQPVTMVPIAPLE
jgi:hypothetical protein